MVTLRAYNTYNASAVFELKGSLYFIESPYTDDQIRQITSAQLTYLVNRLEYLPAEIEREALEDLIEFVREKANEARGQYGNSEISEEELIASLDAYPDEVLVSLLADLRKRYFEERKYDELKTAVNRYWKVRKIQESEVLRSMLVALEMDLNHMLQPLQEIRELLSVTAYPNLQQQFGESVKECMSSLFNFAA